MIDIRHVNPEQMIQSIHEECYRATLWVDILFTECVGRSSYFNVRERDVWVEMTRQRIARNVSDAIILRFPTVAACSTLEVRASDRYEIPPEYLIPQLYCDRAHYRIGYSDMKLFYCDRDKVTHGLRFTIVHRHDHQLLFSEVENTSSFELLEFWNEKTNIWTDPRLLSYEE